MHAGLTILFLVAQLSFGLLLNIRMLNPDGSDGYHKGYLQFSFNKQWKYLCNEFWDDRNSKVVCREFGFAKAIHFNKTSILGDVFHNGFHQLMLHCEGNEKSLVQCPSKNVKSYVFKNKCHQSSQVFIYCSERRDNDAIISLNKEYELRLWSHSNESKKPSLHGVLQYFFDHSWVNICSDGWNDINSFVACSTLGFAKQASNSNEWNLHANSVDPFFNCSGDETSLWDCNFSRKRLGNCNSQQPVKLACKKNLNYVGNEIRLRGGYQAGEGRVEIFNGSYWGTICDDGWDLVDASVVCKELGFGSAAEATHWADNGEGVGLILATDVKCSGKEYSLQQCIHSKNTASCTHSEDAGVRCNIPKIVHKDVQLVGGKSSYEGRIEVTFDGSIWGGICGIGFSEKAGTVVCRQLGLGYVSWASRSYKFGINYNKLMFNVKCLGNELSIKDCHYSPYGVCRYYDMASIICTKHVPDLVMDISTFQQSIKVESHIMSQLRCSFEEKCLSPIVDKLYFQNKNTKRHLLKFTSRFLNKGTSAFRPNVHKENWKWHRCHQHYHSLETFAVYDLIDQDGHPVSEGHKASFCLEDSDCEPGYQQVFNCTDKNDQGISVNCADNYKNSLDCQWIDITEVKDGNYSLRVLVNPSQMVTESDYHNNRAVCEVHYYNNFIQVKECSAEPCYQESFGGNSYGHCCHFPFIYQGSFHYNCINKGDFNNNLWCGTTPDVDKDGMWGYCKMH